MLVAVQYTVFIIIRRKRKLPVDAKTPFIRLSETHPVHLPVSMFTGARLPTTHLRPLRFGANRATEVV